MISTLLILVIALFILLPIALAWKAYAPWVPTKKTDIVRVFELADLKQGEIFYDLGCGDARMVMYASRNFGVKSLGLEIALPFFLIAKLRQFWARDPNVNIKWASLFKQDLSGADVVYVFGVMDTLDSEFQKKLEAEVRKGARVISYAFKIGDLSPKIVDKPTLNSLPIYVYQF